MIVESLEDRILHILSCDANKSSLELFVKKECGIDFRYAASKFPILTENGYGFLDIIGEDEQRNSILLLECKSDSFQLPKAIEEAEYYQKCLDKYGLLQSKDLIGIYHRAILSGSLGSKISFAVKPLTLDPTKLLQHSGHPFNELLLNCRTFMLEWISRRYPISSQEIESVIPKCSFPSYLIDRLESNVRKSYVGFYKLDQPLTFVKLKTVGVYAPLKLEPDQSNDETFCKIEGAKSPTNRFSIQLNRHGYSRPMLFFEIDDEYSACFLHTGRHQVELDGYYESAPVLTKSEKVYGLIEAEAGRYSIAESKGNQVTLELEGRRCKGRIKLNFLDKIYLNENITLT